MLTYLFQHFFAAWRWQHGWIIFMTFRFIESRTHGGTGPLCHWVSHEITAESGGEEQVWDETRIWLKTFRDMHLWITLFPWLLFGQEIRAVSRGGETYLGWNMNIINIFRCVCKELGSYTWYFHITSSPSQYWPTFGLGSYFLCVRATFSGILIIRVSLRPFKAWWLSVNLPLHCRKNRGWR